MSMASVALTEVIDEFFLARLPKKHSEHTLAAYRRDLDTISKALAEVLGTSGPKITMDDLSVRVLRRAFAAISHQSEATISRTWSTWNQLFTFTVAEGILEGNPMAAIEKPRVPRNVNHISNYNRIIYLGKILARCGCAFINDKSFRFWYSRF